MMAHIKCGGGGGVTSQPQTLKTPQTPLDSKTSLETTRLESTSAESAKSPTTLAPSFESSEISEFNPYFCELTAMYWAWKNLKCDYYGLFHYRRLLDFTQKAPYNEDKKLANIRADNPNIAQLFDITQEKLASILSRCDMLASGDPIKNNEEDSKTLTLYESYAKAHHKTDLDIALKIMREKYPHYEEAIQKAIFSTGQRTSWGNVLVMKKELFFEYCEFLFSILFEACKHIDAKSYDPYQARVFGFLAERLMNVFMIHHELHSHTKIQTYRLAKLKNPQPWFGWVHDGNVIKFYFFKIRLIRRQG